MSASFNQVTLLGTLTRDPQIRFLANDKAVGNFGLALNHKYKAAAGEVKEDTTFVDIECWGRTAELVGQFLVKGRQVLISGRLKMDSWEDKDTGAKRSKLAVVADQVTFVGGKKDGERGEGAPSGAPRAQPVDDSEPPF